MVIPAFTFSNYFFLALGIGDALGTKKNNNRPTDINVSLINARIIMPAPPRRGH